jgi:LDH2 family malate/lactate/ureidoglycolate dehydrogenase
VLAIDAGLLAGKDEYFRRATELVGQIKAAKPLQDRQVLLPGEHGDSLAKKAIESNSIEVADEIWEELVSFVE